MIGWEFSDDFFCSGATSPASGAASPVYLSVMSTDPPNPRSSPIRRANDSFETHASEGRSFAIPVVVTADMPPLYMASSIGYDPESPQYAAPPSTAWPDPKSAGPPGAYKPSVQQATRPTEPTSVVIVVPESPARAPPLDNGVDLAERLVRLGFIRKVYVLLIMQLLLTFSCVAVFTFVPAVKQGVRQNAAVLWVAIAVSIGFLIALSCFPKVAKRWPTNLVCLAGFTISEAYLVGAIASFSGSDAVILAVGGTVLLTAGLTLLAWQSCIRFSALSSALFVLLWALIFFGIVVAIAPTLMFRTLYASLGVLFFGLFLVYDTQLVIGRGVVRYSIDEAVNAALMLYLDIIQMFVCLLSIFAARD